MSLLKIFNRTINANTEQELSAKHLCQESQEPESDIQVESPEEAPDSDCPTESITSSSATSMSSKQSRRFRKVWLVRREQWLEYSRQNRGMSCSLCQSLTSNHSTVVVGTRSLVIGCDYKAYLSTNEVPHTRCYTAGCSCCSNGECSCCFESPSISKGNGASILLSLLFGQTKNTTYNK